MKPILVVDDEKRMRELIREHLEAAGYQVTEAADGMAALELFQRNAQGYEAVILDVMMPELDGWSLCREIRRHSQVPVIMLTARGEEYDKLFGFELGVDDYLVKPFRPRELMARLKAVLRRGELAGNTTGSASQRWQFQGLTIDATARQVLVDEAPVKLTPREYELLLFLAQHPGQAFSREQLLDQVWGYDFVGEDRTVDTHIKMLRENLKPYKHFLVTVWGHGYKFEVGEGS